MYNKIIKRKNFRKNHRVKKKYLTRFPFCCILPKVIGMEKIVEQGLLYDFYGELLTDHQKKIYEDVVFADLSLSEIAREYGISRQGAHDLVKRCNNILQEYEDKLHLIRKFLIIREKIKEIDKVAGDESLSRKELAEEIRQAAGQILEEL